jgi:hypothetical protein
MDRNSPVLRSSSKAPNRTRAEEGVRMGTADKIRNKNCTNTAQNCRNTQQQPVENCKKSEMAPVLCGWQVDLVQERGISRVAVQVLEQGVYFYEDQTAVMLGVGAVQPLEGFIALIPQGINSSY